MKKPNTRIERIVREYFEPYNATIMPDDLDYVMDFLKVMIQMGRKK